MTLTICSQTKRLYDRINHLGLIDRAIILLWLEGMTYEEIGAIIGISVKNNLIQERSAELKALVDTMGRAMQYLETGAQDQIRYSLISFSQ